MKVYVVTVFNTFSNGHRYSEVSNGGFERPEDAQAELEKLCMRKSPYSETVYEDTHKSYNFSTGKFESMRSALISEVWIK